MVDGIQGRSVFTRVVALPVASTYLGLGIVLYFCLFYELGAYPLLNDNEGLYAEIAREMLETRSLVIPTLDYVPYIEKPPLLYWLIAQSYALLGVSETAARLVPAGSAALLCVSLPYFCRRFAGPQTGILAAFLLASSLGFGLLARTVMFDMLLTALIAFSLLSFYQWYESAHRRPLLLAYLFMALAVLTKGLLALVLVPLTVIVFLLWVDPQRIGRLLDARALSLFLIATVPWHVAAVVSDPGFGWFYFVNEHLLRFLGDRQPADYHTGPIYYYVPFLLAGCLPWTGWLVLGLRRPARLAPFERFLLVWLVVFFTFFSISAGKAGYYLVTAMPAAAIFAAMQIERFARNGQWRLNGIATVLGLASVAAILLTIILPYRNVLASVPELRMPAVAAAVFMLGVVAIMGSQPFLALRPVHLVAAVSALGIPIAVLLVAGAGFRQDEISDAAFAQTVQRRAAGRPVVLYRDFEEISSLLFYLRRRLPIVDSVSRDLRYGQHSAFGRNVFLSSAELHERLASEKPYIVVPARRRTEFDRGPLGKESCLAVRTQRLLLYTSEPRECLPHRTTSARSATPGRPQTIYP